MAKYFHKLTKQERDELLKSDMTNEEFIKQYKQPNWCNYPNALSIPTGCWSLLSGKIKKYEDCKGCDCLIKKRSLNK